MLPSRITQASRCKHFTLSMGALFSRPEPEEGEVSETITPSTPMVMLYSYIGTGMHGLQFSRDEICVENYLFEALIKSRVLPKDAYLNLNRIKWSEASRTDAGVHAAAQVLSCVVSVPSGHKMRDIPSLINQNISKDINLHVWACICPVGGFRAQKFADARRYNYLMPLHAFKDPTKSHLEMISRDVLPIFIGNKLYHNYTKRVKADSASAWRTIMEFSVSDPFEVGGEKFVLWTIYGKSFMMNQIRKMLATVLAYSHGLLTVDQIHETFTAERWALPKVPGDGLLLDKVEYESFRRKMKTNDKGRDVEFTTYRSSIEQWKVDILFPHIARIVRDQDIFRDWVQNVLMPFPPVPQSDPRAEHRSRSTF